VHAIAYLTAEDLRKEITNHLKSSHIGFAQHENGVNVIVPGHRPMDWTTLGPPQPSHKAAKLTIYEETTTLVLSYLIDRFNARVFFDVGAGIGYFSRIAATHQSVPVSTHAFEMTPPRLETLRANLAKEGLGSRVKAHLAGISDTHKGEVEIWYAHGMMFETRPDPREAREAWWRRLKFALRGDKTRELQSAQALITTLDHYAQSSRVWPDIIKIDVEGYEGAVLNGGKKVLSTRRPLVLLELHKDKKLRFGTHRRDVVQLLFDLGYQALFFTDHQSKNTCEIVEVTAQSPLIARQETDLILFFHRDYLIERRHPETQGAMS